MPEWDIFPPFSSKLLESVLKVAIAVAAGVTVFFLALGVKDTMERGLEFSWGLFLGAAGAAVVALFDYWYLQMLKRRRPPKPSPTD